MIVPATADDLPALCELLGLLFTQEADFQPDREKQIAGLRLILDHPESGLLFVARCEGTVAGMVSLLEGVNLREGGRAFWLEDLVVQPTFRGRGLGGALLRHAIATARALGAVSLTLLTDATNARAIRLYQAHGFTATGPAPMRLRL